MRLACYSLAALAVFSSASRPDEGKLTAVQLARLGKAATALVECDIPRGKKHGSAFCIHSSGLFVTNAHVVRDASAVRLVLNPSLKTQRIAKAVVVRVDAASDLALLRADGLKGLKPLALGSTEGIEELMDVIACGFPFGRSLTIEKDDYPAVSINKGTITSLRRKGGALHRIQVDVALNPGNSGGPLLDGKAQVVGVVVSGVAGTGVNFVIPVGQLTLFLAKPTLAFSLPRISAAAKGKPAVFEARAVALLPGGKPPELELVLSADGKERRFPMKREGDAYRASAVPVPGTAGTARLRAVATYPEGSVAGTVLDAPFKVGGKARRLAEVRAIRRLPEAGIEFRDGGKIAGLPAGLEEVEVLLGGETLRLKVSAMSSIAFESDEPSLSVTCTVFARVGGKVVAQASDSLAFGGGAGGGGVAAVSPPVVPPKIVGDKLERRLPAKATDAVMAGGGRYLLLMLPSLKRVEIFDISELRFAGHIPVASADAKIAGGQKKIVVVLPGDGIVQRWDLATRKRELSVPMALKDRQKIEQVAMGCASDGPVLVAVSPSHPALGGVQLLSLATLKPLPVKMPRNAFMHDAQAPVRASADGRVFGCYIKKPVAAGRALPGDRGATRPRPIRCTTAWATSSPTPMAATSARRAGCSPTRSRRSARPAGRGCTACRRCAENSTWG